VTAFGELAASDPEAEDDEEVEGVADVTREELILGVGVTEKAPVVPGSLSPGLCLSHNLLSIRFNSNDEINSESISSLRRQSFHGFAWGYRELKWLRRCWSDSRQSLEQSSAMALEMPLIWKASLW
jgi:hypothetical protein